MLFGLTVTDRQGVTQEKTMSEKLKQAAMNAQTDQDLLAMVLSGEPASTKKSMSEGEFSRVMQELESFVPLNSSDFRTGTKNEV